MSFQSRCSRTARFWRAAVSPKHRRTDPQPHRPARSHDRPGRFVQPERKRYCQCNRGAGGRQDFSGRLFRGRTASADRRATASPGSIPRPAWQIRSTRTRTSRVISIAVQADGKILAGGYFFGANSIGGQTRNRIARLDPTTGLADSFDPNANSVSMQSRCRRTARFWRAAISPASADRRATTSPGSIATTGLADSFDPNANSFVDSIAVQADGKILAGGSFTERTASADRRATASPGSMPRPAWLIHSTRTRMVMSIQSRCRRTARYWRAAVSRTSADRRAIFSLV